MADERLLAAVRRFWNRAQCESAYAAVLAAYSNAATLEVSITGTSFDGQSASGQFVLDRPSMAAWMDVLESRLAELDAAASGLPEMVSGSPFTNFSTRIVGT